MRKIHCHVLSFLPPVRTYFAHWRLCYKSLTHNTFDSTAESMFEPLFYSVDFAIRWFGVAFVTAVICLVTSVVTLFYMNVMPYIITTHSAPYAYIHLLYGHYLLVMIMFNYYKAVRTEPGVPPSASSNMPVTSICKKCICPKPPRAHHCSVCKRCRLKMDHHCPWLNGCVGHYNHRYFICFCTFMLLGTFYVSLSSWPIFCDCFRFYDKAAYAKDSIYSMFGYNTTNQALFRTPQNAGLCANRDRFFNSGTVFLWILCSAVTVALGCLTFWHFYLISCGETSVEQLINSRERKRLKKLGRKFVNPYHLGLLQNWKYLLGFSSYKSFFRKVLLPSTHLPQGNGIVWETNNQKPAVLT